MSNDQLNRIQSDIDLIKGALGLNAPAGPVKLSKGQRREQLKNQFKLHNIKRITKSK